MGTILRLNLFGIKHRMFNCNIMQKLTGNIIFIGQNLFVSR